MGGFAFNKLGLKTPRMTPEKFYRLRDRTLSQLSTLYSIVVSPAEGPEKETYGDVDILVQDSKGPAVDIVQIKNLIGATHTVKAGNTWSFAIPDDEDQNVHIQVDVHICHGTIYWEEFLDAYGDFFTILGTILRMHRLLADDHGFHLLVFPIVEHDKKASRLTLTTSPAKCLEFLGLDYQQYRRGFSTVNEMFIYLASSRLYSPIAFAGQLQTHNDRAKLRKRPIFARWLQEFVPQTSAEGYFGSRDEIALEAIEIFSKEKEYKDMLLNWDRMRREKAWWKQISQGLLTEEQAKSSAFRQLKRDFSSLQPPLTPFTDEAAEFVKRRLQET